MKALVLAAGLGTRLRPLTNLRAKPALPVVGVPSFWFGAWHLARELNPSAFAINLSHLPETVRQAGEDADLRRFTGIRFHYSDEGAQVLGSSGALWKLKGWIGGDTLAVCNGDTISFPAWKRMLELHREKKALITMHVRAHTGSLEAYTDIEVAADGRVTDFKQKATSGLMFSGAYLLEPSLLARLPDGVSELRPTLLEPLIREKKLFAFREDLEWLDTGSVSSYAHAQLELLRVLPSARELVEVKMREELPGVWVPRDWVIASGRPAFVSPVVVSGAQSEWASHARVLGPRFIGIMPPPAGTPMEFQNALVCSVYTEKL